MSNEKGIIESANVSPEELEAKIVENFDVEAARKQEVLLSRRKEIFEMRLRGMKPREIASKLSVKYGVLESTIDHDWHIRNSWLLDVIGISDLTGLVAGTVGSFNLSQHYRQQLLFEVFDLITQLKDNAKSIEEMEMIPSVWGMMMRLLNDIDVAEEKKSAILMKMGILHEAPKRLEINKKEIKIEHKLDLQSLVSGLSESARREFFEHIEEASDLPGEDDDEEAIDITPDDAEKE